MSFKSNYKKKGVDKFYDRIQEGQLKLVDIPTYNIDIPEHHIDIFDESDQVVDDED